MIPVNIHLRATYELYLIFPLLQKRRRSPYDASDFLHLSGSVLLSFLFRSQLHLFSPDLYDIFGAHEQYLPGTTLRVSDGGARETIPERIDAYLSQ